MEKKYTPEEIKNLSWQEHVRLRPSMYIGRVNIQGFVELLKGIFSVTLNELNATDISFELAQSSSGMIRVEGISQPLVDNWSQWNPRKSPPFSLQFQILNALSKSFSIELNKIEPSISIIQNYKEGTFLNGDEFDEDSDYSSMEIAFTLDDKIWGNDFEWREDFIRDAIRELAYLHRGVKLSLRHYIDDQLSNSIFRYSNGLFDKIDSERLKGLGGCYLATHIIEELEDLNVEIAFAFRDYSVDQKFLNAYCNDYYTSENGSHVDGLLKGLTNGVMKYFQKNDLIDRYRISEKGIAENVIAAINIRMGSPEFSGCVKNKLASPQVVQPIANLVANELFSMIEKDEESTQRLIRKFEM